MNIDPLADELYLRLVLEQQPGAATSGKRRAIWLDIAHAVNDASDRVVFRTASGATQRLKFLSTVLDNTDHAFHGDLTREMREMLHQIRGDRATPPTRVRTRSQIHAIASEDDTAIQRPSPKKPRRKTTRGDDDDSAKPAAIPGPLVAVPPPSSIVPYGVGLRHTALDQYLGAQAERDRQACYEREQLRRDLALIERRVATTPGATVPSDGMGIAGVVHLLEDVSAQQRLVLEEMRSERASHREQVATMIGVLQQALRREGTGDGVRARGDDSAFGDAATDRSAI